MNPIFVVMGMGFVFALGLVLISLAGGGRRQQEMHALYSDDFLSRHVARVRANERANPTPFAPAAPPTGARERYARFEKRS